MSSKVHKSLHHGHKGQINQLSVCSDNEHFLSADFHAVNLWNFDSAQCYSMIDVRESQSPTADLITHAEYHPQNPNVFVYSTTGGYFDYCDMRVSSQIKSSAITFRASLVAPVLNRIGCAKFIGAHSMVSRDYLHVMHWDIRNNKQPTQILNISTCDQINSVLNTSSSYYQTYDLFKLDVSPSNTQVLTGFYNSQAHIIDL